MNISLRPSLLLLALTGNPTFQNFGDSGFKCVDANPHSIKGMALTDAKPTHFTSSRAEENNRVMHDPEEHEDSPQQETFRNRDRLHRRALQQVETLVSQLEALRASNAIMSKRLEDRESCARIPPCIGLEPEEQECATEPMTASTIFINEVAANNENNKNFGEDFIEIAAPTCDAISSYSIQALQGPTTEIQSVKEKKNKKRRLSNPDERNTTASEGVELCVFDFGMFDGTSGRAGGVALLDGDDCVVQFVSFVNRNATGRHDGSICSFEWKGVNSTCISRDKFPAGGSYSLVGTGITMGKQLVSSGKYHINTSPNNRDFGGTKNLLNRKDDGSMTQSLYPELIPLPPF